MSKRFINFMVILTILMVGGMSAVLTTTPVSAAPEATITVDSTADTVVAGDGECTLREAINNANSDSDTTAGDCAAGSGDDVIDIPAGTYTLAIAGADEDGNASGDLDILSNLTLQGAGADQTVLDGDQLDRLLHVAAEGAVVEVNDLTVENGRVAGVASPYPTSTEHGGGGIFNAGGDLTLNHAVVSQNTIDTAGDTAGAGAGLLNLGGVLLLNNVEVSGNSVFGAPTSTAGAGIASIGRMADAELHVHQSQIVNNENAAPGGGIFVLATDPAISHLMVSESVIDNNTAEFGGGIYVNGNRGDGPQEGIGSFDGRGASYSDKAMTSEVLRTSSIINITDSMISDNETTVNGGGLLVSGATLQIERSTISGNVTSSSGGQRTGAGGGIFVIRSDAEITNSTISGNSALGTGSFRIGLGGGMHIVSVGPASVTLANSTIVDNIAENLGAGIGSDNDGGPDIDRTFA